MGNSFCFDWEISVLEAMQSAESPLLTALANVITTFGEEFFLILLVGLFYWCIDKRLGRNVALAVIGSILFGSMIQGLVLRRRPYMDYSQILCLRPAHSGDIMSPLIQGYSLPSLHSTLTVGGYGMLALNVRKRLLTCIVIAIALLIGVFRVYLGVHYPTDVLCGWALGIIVMLAFWLIERKWGYKAGFLVQLAIGILGFFYCQNDMFFLIYGVIIGLFFGFWYEEKRVHFEMNKRWWSYILRPIIGMLVFLGVSALLELPVNGIPAGEYMAFRFGYRCFRYALATFVTIGLYPHLFRYLRFL